ncbi:hypothetical protein C7E19_24730, partial [Stenotrophomonas maltophilia]
GEHLRALGLTHLVAISGFHVGVVAGFGVLLCRAVRAGPGTGRHARPVRQRLGNTCARWA